jgi:hypothetical protein
MMRRNVQETGSDGGWSAIFSLHFLNGCAALVHSPNFR